MKRFHLQLGCMAFLIASFVQPVYSQQTIGDICRVKGQEENVIHGIGLVVGLKGTGDGKSRPTSRALARMMQQLGGQISSDMRGNLQIEDVADAANVAAVIVTATIPPAGAQQGDKITCYVSAIHAKSLEGGILMLTPLLGPRSDRPRVYALAQGQVGIPDRTVPTTGVVYMGVKMEATVKNEFVQDGKITLVLDGDHSSFSTASRIEDEINNLNAGGLQTLGSGNNQAGSTASKMVLARAIDQTHVVVDIPSQYRDSPVRFLDLLMEIRLPQLRSNNRVVINEREGVVVIGEDVQVAPVAISHKNLSISGSAPTRSFVGFDAANGRQASPKLKNLIDALNALEVPTADVISIIKTLKKRGDIYGEVIIQ